MIILRPFMGGLLLGSAILAAYRPVPSLERATELGGDGLPAAGGRPMALETAADMAPSVVFVLLWTDVGGVMPRLEGGREGE
jgi:hypothetical protein